MKGLSNGALGGWFRSPRAATALFGAVMVAFWAPVFLGRSFWLRDILLYTYPLKMAVRARLLRGELPLWEPHWGTGRPLFGFIQPGALDPMNALALLPVPVGLDLFMVGYSLVLAFGARRWLRALGADAWESSIGALWVALSGYAVSILATLGSYAWGVAWIPWSLAMLAEHAPVRGRASFVRGVALTTVFLALGILAGDPMAAFFAGLLGLAQALGESDRGSRWRALGMLALASVGCGVVCAVQLLPAVEVASVARGSGIDLTRASYWSFPPARLVELALVDPFGAPHTRDWFVHPLYVQARSAGQEPLASSVHQGLAVLPLALVALVRRSRREVALAVFTGLMLVFALGRHAPFWALWYRLCPPARLFRYPEKYWLVVTLGLAALATRGLSVARSDVRLARRVSVGVALGLGLVAVVGATEADRVVAALVGPMSRPRLDDAAFALVRSVARAAVLAAGFAALVRVASREDGEHRVAWLPGRLALVGLLLAVEPFWAGLTQRSWAPHAVHAEAPPLGRVLAEHNGGALRGVRVHRSLRMRFPVELSDAETVVASLPPNVGLMHGIAYVAPYDVLNTPPTLRFERQTIAHPVEAARVAGARFLVVYAHDPPPPGTIPRAVDRRLDLGLVEVMGTSPRVYLARRVTVAPGFEAALDGMMAPGAVPGEDAFIERASPVARASGACRVVRDDPERVELDCASDAPTYAVLLDTYFPGWNATANGAPAPILRANGGFRAVPVGVGRTRVVMRYEPFGLRLGALISLVGVALVIAGLVFSRRERMREGTQGNA